MVLRIATKESKKPNFESWGRITEKMHEELLISKIIDYDYDYEKSKK